MAAAGPEPTRPGASATDLARQPRSPHETAVLGLAWLGTVLTIGGVGGALSGYGRIVDEGALVTAIGLVLTSLSIAVGYPLTTLRAHMAGTTGGTDYDALRRWGRLKAIGITLQLIAVASTVLLAFALLVKGNLAQVSLSSAILHRGTLVLVAALAVTMAAAHLTSLRTPTPRDRTSTTAIVAFLGLGLSALLAVVGALVVLGLEDSLGTGARAARGDVELLLLGSAVAASFCLYLVRGLPTITVLTNEARASYQGGPRMSRSYNVFLPALVAFALLLLVFLLFVLFGVGVRGILDEVARSPILLGVFAFLFLAFLVCLLVAVRLARTDEVVRPLFKTPVSRKEKTENRILAASVAAAFILLLPAAALYLGYDIGVPSGAWIHFLCLGILAGIGPYGFYAAKEHRRVRRLEERFPDFLRDIASSHKGGLTLNHAVTIAAGGEYGDLTPEVRKMADQLSWNVSFNEALERFSERVETPLVQRAVSLILQANKSGGATTDVLLAAARDAREIKNLENERRLSMSLYTIVIYITFFVFLGVAAVLYAQFVPAIVESSRATSEAGTALAGSGITGQSLREEQFQLFYFMAAVMQGLGDGIVAGLMGQGRAVLGLRHAFVMVLISYVTFSLFLV